MQKNKLKVYPNPLNGLASIEMLSDGQPISIDLMDLQGRTIQRIYDGHGTAGFGLRYASD